MHSAQQQHSRQTFAQPLNTSGVMLLMLVNLQEDQLVQHKKQDNISKQHLERLEQMDQRKTNQNSVLVGLTEAQCHLMNPVFTSIETLLDASHFALEGLSSTRNMKKNGRNQEPGTYFKSN